MLQRVRYAIGRFPNSSCDVRDNTVLTFVPPLSVGEEALVAAIMADDPTHPPTPVGTVLYVTDIYERLAEFSAATGVTWQIFFDESTPGSGFVDRIVLQADSILPTSVKNKVKTEFSKLINEAV